MRRDGLMSAVFTGDVAELAADAQVMVDIGDDLVIQVEIAPILHFGDGTSAKILDGAEAAIVHVLRESVDQILDDAESVVHGRGAHLNGRRAQSDMLRSVVPVTDPADAADRQPRSLRHGGNQMQRDRLHRGAAISAVR